MLIKGIIFALYGVGMIFVSVGGFVLGDKSVGWFGVIWSFWGLAMGVSYIAEYFCNKKVSEIQNRA